jgi:hypothetical protein
MPLFRADFRISAKHPTRIVTKGGFWVADTDPMHKGWPLQENVALLIVHLTNHADLIEELVEVAQASLDRPQPDLVAIPGGGHTTRNTQEIVEFDSNARERLRAVLSKLEGKA